MSAFLFFKKMSEHIGVKGKCEYWHLPYDSPIGFTWCNQCKKTCRVVQVEFHQGLSTDNLIVRCGKCGHGLWTADIERQKNILNKKCSICGKKTSWVDSYCVVSAMFRPGRDYLCSAKCSKIFDKRDKENDKQGRNSGKR